MYFCKLSIELRINRAWMETVLFFDDVISSPCIGKISCRMKNISIFFFAFLWKNDDDNKRPIHCCCPWLRNKLWSGNTKRSDFLAVAAVHKSKIYNSTSISKHWQYVLFESVFFFSQWIIFPWPNHSSETGRKHECSCPYDTHTHTEAQISSEKKSRKKNAETKNKMKIKHIWPNIYMTTYECAVWLQI